MDLSCTSYFLLKRRRRPQRPMSTPLASPEGTRGQQQSKQKNARETQHTLLSYLLSQILCPDRSCSRPSSVAVVKYSNKNHNLGKEGGVLPLIPGFSPLLCGNQGRNLRHCVHSLTERGGIKDE